MSGKKGNEAQPPPALAVPDHELLQRIGGGSYGEVWLARATTGALRAVKIVHRAAFDNPRPYEREFAGLLHFEPLSRQHDGLVDILQVGRNDDAGYFYCVMELADDAASGQLGERGRVEEDSTSPLKSALTRPAARSPTFSPATYTSATLESRIRSNSRLPVPECVAIATKLAEALQFLHKAGLVHRDIKPSNIIFADGVPKLADVGLVARVDDARSFVGTEGFVPPEGPGTVKADIYSLGKCLYEMAMGKDRQAFPSPPTLLAELPDRKDLLELNEIITRACEPEPKQRYASATTLLAELRALGAGGSVRKLRHRRRLKRFTLYFASLTAMAAAAWQLRSPLRLMATVPKPYGETTSVLVGDVDGDGDAELVSATPTGLASLMARNGTLIHSFQLLAEPAQAVQITRLLDLNGGGGLTPVFQWQSGSNLFLSLLNRQLVESGLRVNATAAVARVKGVEKLEGYLTPVGGCPPTGTNAPQLLCRFSGGFLGSPYVLSCYDATNGVLLWRRETGASPGHAARASFAPAGQPAWLVGCDSTMNESHTPDGENDRQSYLHAYDGRGERLWSFRTGGIFTHCEPLIVRSHETDYLIAGVGVDDELATQSSNRAPPSGQILRFNAAGEVLTNYDLGAGLYSMAAADLNADGVPEILATDGHGFLHVLDPQLRQLAKIAITQPTHDWVRLDLQPAPLDLDGDGRLELVLLSAQVEFIGGRDPSNLFESQLRRYRDVRLRIFDSSLKPGANHLLSEETPAMGFTLHAAPRRGGPTELAVVSTDVKFFRYQPRKLWPFGK